MRKSITSGICGENMKKGEGIGTISPYRLWSLLPRVETSHLPDLLMFAAAIALFYGILAVARTWLGPFTPSVEISQSPLALPAYAGLSLLRITLAYLLSLVFTLVYGYVAAYNPRAERFMIPLLDVLQSIPVLSFLPGVMLAMVALFPRRQLGVEVGAILLIFTGQVWNMAFSFYASLKSIPREMREAAQDIRIQLVAAFYRGGIAFRRNWTGVEFDDVRSRGMVRACGVRNVRARLPRLSAAGSGLVSTNRRQHRRYPIHFVRRIHHDRRHRAA